MNAYAICQLFEYHFAENLRLMEAYVPQLSPAQFMQPVAYSHGSVRDQLVHIMSVDKAWFSDLRGEEIPVIGDPGAYVDVESIRLAWHQLEEKMREYLGVLKDEQLMDQPLEGEDKGLYVWQVLVHVVNHGTDHRAQILRNLHDLGVKTKAQDLIFFVYDNP